MNAPDVERVVPLQFVLQHDGVVANYVPQMMPIIDGGAGRNIAGGWSDGGQAGDGAREQAQELGPFFRNPGDDQPGDGSKRSGHIGIQESGRGDRIHADLAAGVEAIPSEPKQPGTQGHQRNAMRAAPRPRGGLPT